ncbi:MAG: ABC transporter ATP-binding protein [Candidatus Gracilibacteria bacterium]
MKVPSQNHYWQLLKALWRFSPGRHGIVVVTYVLFILANTVTMMEPLVFGLFINSVQEGGPDLLRKTVFYLGLYALLAMVFWVFHGPARILERQTAFHVSKQFHDYLFKILLKLSLGWHKDHHSGSVMSRVKKATHAIASFADDGFIFIETIVRFLFSLIAIFLLLPKFGVLSILIGVGVVVVIFRFDRVLVRNTEKINELGHDADATFYDYIANIKTVITLRLGRLARGVFSTKFFKIFPVWKRNNVVNEAKWFCVSVGLTIMNFAILFFYIYDKISAGEVILLGSLMALYQYTDRFVNVFFNLASQYERLVWYHTDLRAIDGIEHAYHQLPPRVREDEEQVQHFQSIQIRNLFFRYQDEKQRSHNIEKVHLDLKPGLKIALVGESGSGKSTLMTLLRGLHDVDRVNVTIDGKRFDSLRAISSMVTLIPQDPEIFENTIEYNVTAGISHTKQGALEMCRLARFDKVVARLPKGLKTHIKEKGVNLSGGEKQRLALARGFFAARESSILLLDEPTSSVDSRNEMMIYQNLFETFGDRCIVSSIHRLHLLRLFDVIYVFEQGKQVAQGSLEELLKTSELFQKMWKTYSSKSSSKSPPMVSRAQI